MMTMAKPTSPAGHDADCMCVPCMMADMDAALIEQGLDPAKYRDSRDAMSTSERTRYATPGAQCGRGVVRLLSPRQVAFIKRLMAERDTSNLVRLPGSENIERMSLRGASDLIEKLLACPELPAAERPSPLATPAQVNYALSLCNRKGMELTRSELASQSKRDISITIDKLKKLPDRPIEVKVAAELEAGIYLLNDTVYKVQRAVHGSGRMYAKMLDKETGRFEYASGAVKSIKPEHKMTLDQAKEYGAIYGVCCACGRTLTDENSIEQGIGPVCIKKFA